MQSNYVQQCINLECGDVYLIASEKGLVSVSTQIQEKIPLIDLTSALYPRQKAILFHAMQELTEYFMHARQTFTVPFDISGTPFHQKVWAELLTIPYGQTITYGELARRVGNPKAARAVGAANGKNPLWIIIPCHRVIQSDGTLGGYAGGNRVKQFLLSLEQEATR